MGTLAWAGAAPDAQTAADAQAWTVSDGDVQIRCPMTVGGSFTATTAGLGGVLTPDVSNPSAYTGELTVDLSSLETGISLRDNHLRSNYLEIDRGEGFERAVLSGIQLDEPWPGTDGDHETEFSGTLLLHGVEREVRGDAGLRYANGRLEVEATFPVSIEAFEIPTPRYLGVGVRDEVEATIEFVATTRN